MMVRKTRQVAEFGDFQTPDGLAQRCLLRLQRLGVKPATVIEPSCGLGTFLVAAAGRFERAALFGLDINPRYLAETRRKLQDRKNVTLVAASFFEYDWSTVVEKSDAPILVLGNPPWVTNAELGAIGSLNLPEKTNFQGLSGFDALTGKSNFDISEWMLLRNIDWVSRRGGAVAVLCKTAVARKVIGATLRRNIRCTDARIYRIDAASEFGAAVDACLFYLAVDDRPPISFCQVFDTIESSEPSAILGMADGKLVADLARYDRYRNLHGVNKAYTWRSGVKHDCSKIMEFTRENGLLRNGLGETADIEETYLFPLIKSSDIAGTRKKVRQMSVLVTQRSIGEETSRIADLAPRTWSYLLANGERLDRRTSAIYRDKPRFSIFGVGAYTFAPWKIAVSGLYKRLEFRLYGSVGDRPPVFDDTVYFLPFQSYGAANSVLEMLSSDEAQSFLQSMIFWDEKRPITADVLKRLDIAKLAQTLGRENDLIEYPPSAASEGRQLSFLDEDAA